MEKAEGIYEISRDIILTKDTGKIELFLSNTINIKKYFNFITDEDIKDLSYFKTSLAKFIFLFSLDIEIGNRQSKINNIKEFILVRLDEGNPSQ